MRAAVNPVYADEISVPTLCDASHLCFAFVGDAGYGLAYGSHAIGTAATDSDLGPVVR